jgi:molybdopterin adenylyltransferase
MSNSVSLNIAVLCASDTRTLASDNSGAYLAQALQNAGHQLHERALVRDDKYQLRAKVSAWIADASVDVILITGGTGFTGRDGTPEAIAPLLDKDMPGFAVMMHQLSFTEIGASTLQSRAIAGLANATFVFCLPGSKNACETAWIQLIEPQLNSQSKPCNLVQLRDRLRE